MARLKYFDFFRSLLGHASLWAAIAADMGVSLIVISNALKLLRERS
jgi:cation transport ATPase